MELGETRVEKATRWVGDKFDGIEWHVYRMGRSERHHEIPSSSGKPNADRHERHSQ